MTRKIVSFLSVLAVIGSILLVTSPAKAETDPALDWFPLDTDSNGKQHVSKFSSVKSCTKVLAVWEQSNKNGLGTSVETKNLGIEVDADDEVSVEYTLDGADVSGGSVRLFIFLKPDADTFNEVPAMSVSATLEDSGILSLTVPGDGVIGTAGVVYDTSNGGVPGMVKFENLTVAGEKVFFKTGCAPVSTPTPTPSPMPSETSTAAPTFEATAPPEGDGGVGTLPVTGARVWTLVVLGIVAFASGLLLVLFGRIKRVY